MASNITIKNARIIFRNFSGRKDDYNPNGNKKFSVVLEEWQAGELEADGWNIKPLKKRNDDDPTLYHLPVFVNFAYRAPTVVCVQNGIGTRLTDDTIGMLDWADIKNVDLVIRPRPYSGRLGEGIKAYLQSMGVEIESDEVAEEYSKYLNSDEETPF